MPPVATSEDRSPQEQPQPVAWREERDGKEIVVVRASAYGHCLRALCANLCGYDPRLPDDRSLQRMDEGNLHEPDILRRVKEDHGWEALSPEAAAERLTARGRQASVHIDDADKAQVRVEMDVLRNVLMTRGHTDGVVFKYSAERVAETKALGRDIYKPWVAAHDWNHSGQFRNYAVQLSLYMYATDLPGLFACKNRDTGDLDVHLVETPPVGIGELRAKAALILAGARHGALPDCDRKPEWFCNFRYLHVIEDDDERERRAPDAAELEELERLGENWRFLREVENACKERRKVVSERVREIVGDKGSASTPSYSVTAFESKRSSYDYDALRADLEAIGRDLDEYQVQTKFKQVRFTPRATQGRTT